MTPMHAHPSFGDRAQLAVYKLGALALGIGAIAVMGYGVVHEIHWLAFGLVLLMTAMLGRLTMIELPHPELPHHYLVPGSKSADQTQRKAS